LRRRLGRDLLDRFAALPNHWRHGRYLFIHAGIHPGLDLAAQLAKPWGEFPLGEIDADPLWVRGPFLTHEGRFQEDVVVVHGHTIMRIPQIRHNRIGIDTGAFMTGRLTAVELRGDRLRLITVIGPELPWGH
jgi:serine/threonine protein phosphatase 1